MRAAMNRRKMNSNGILSMRLHLLTAILVPAIAMAQTPGKTGLVMRSVREVGQLANAAAMHAYPIQLEGVVTYSDVEWGLLFVEDATGGIFIDVRQMGISIPAGTRVRVDAV